MNTMKKVTVFQTASKGDFAVNMHAAYDDNGTFVELSKMEQVVMLRYPSEDDDEFILEDLFSRLNDEEYRYSINYSMSVGDVVQIDHKTYRCMPCGWLLLL